MNRRYQLQEMYRRKNRSLFFFSPHRNNTGKRHSKNYQNNSELLRKFFFFKRKNYSIFNNDKIINTGKHSNRFVSYETKEKGVDNCTSSKTVPFFRNDTLFYKHLISKVNKSKNKNSQKNKGENFPNYISNCFFYQLYKFHINFLNNFFGESFLKFPKTSKIFFGVLSSFCLILSFLLISSTNYLEFNIILKYHIKFHSLLFAFFSSYYLALQIGSYYISNNFYFLLSSFYFFNSILSLFLADYDIWNSYLLLSFNYFLFLMSNYYYLYRKQIPKHVFKYVNGIIYFTLLSFYVAVNKGKYIEQNIEYLKQEHVQIPFYKMMKLKPYFL